MISVFKALEMARKSPFEAVSMQGEGETRNTNFEVGGGFFFLQTIHLFPRPVLFLPHPTSLSPVLGVTGSRGCLMEMSAEVSLMCRDPKIIAVTGSRSRSNRISTTSYLSMQTCCLG